ncbi:hypothetical protein [Priestia megaterium]|uniref:hypothetical protein n=1 Tax=Priestia megaterium TaxID=1404 RepID=UPI000BF6B2CC|nr:hypothetical protein [Priestia megaterium]RCX28694.1 hypothetical protein DEU47_101246 [Bacillus sp. AG236]MDC7722793.1 hypothetical protein [Priestia megaterium]MEE3892245.1 hypothetical protein [Priestia megaterium]PFK99518.1 hypothetical protein COJ01_18420 [Priestia megaterium]WRQ94132.1 hypothetical protein NQ126_006730 [Priestia megaterium]
MREAIRSQIGKLIGLNLQYAGRASNLFWLGFGELISVTRRGKTEELAEYALDIQCSWRIIKDNKILVGSRDFYSPRTGWNQENDDFDWDVQGNNRFDERIESFIENTKEHVAVERVEPDEVGGLKIFLSQGYLLEVFPDTSEDDEYSEFWRFFNRRENSPHFVVTGNGTENE